MENTTEARQAGLLAPYQGCRPEAPAWFGAAMANAPERSFFDVEGTAIELLTWGERGKPGLLFLHGDSAHADWYSFICPFFARDYRCAAISFSGMGSSGRRDAYSFDDWAKEAVAAIGAANFSDMRKPIVVAHSLGGNPAILAAQSGQFGGLITVDSALIPAHLAKDLPVPVPRPHRFYATQAEALARFRFMPATISGQHYLVDHVARTGLREVEVNGETGWQWRFDPQIWGSAERDPALLPDPRTANCRVAVIVGERSVLITPDVLAYMHKRYSDGVPFAAIPEAGHHVMIDQPLALVACLRAFIAQWIVEGDTR